MVHATTTLKLAGDATVEDVKEYRQQPQSRIDFGIQEFPSVEEIANE